ncbi:MAG: stage V sporulation protein AC [Clostridia bacterium]|nr:stage V sporulation protein AC [Clostridia bacterium]
MICTNNNYKEYVDARAKKSNILKDCTLAFLVGGIICCLGKCMGDMYKALGVSEEIVKILVPVSLVLISVILTGVGIFDKIAKQAGAGTLVPITGFANAVASPAIDNKSEGFVMGVGAKMFVVAGPVIVYGTTASVICGTIEVVVKWLF